MALSEKKIKLIIEAEVKKAVSGLKKVETSTKKVAKSTKGMNKSFLNMASAMAGAFAAVKGIQAVGDMAKLSDTTKALHRNMLKLGAGVGFTSKSLDKFRKATDNTVTDIDLMTSANNALLLGIVDSDDGFAELIDSAQRLGQAVGLDTKSALDSLVTGMGRQSKLMLDNLGIMIDTGKAYDNYAEKIGISTSALTDNQKKLAFNEATMESVRQKVETLGDEVLTTSDTIAAMSNSWVKLKTAVGTELTDPTKGFGKGMIAFFDNITKMVETGGFRGLVDFQYMLDMEAKVAADTQAEEYKTNETRRNQETIDMFVNRYALLAEYGGAYLTGEQDAQTAHTEWLNNEGKVRFDNVDAYTQGAWFIKDAEAKASEDRFQEGQKQNKKANDLQMRDNMLMAIQNGATVKEAAIGTMKAKMLEAHSSLLAEIFKMPFPLNVVLAAGSGAIIDKAFSTLSSFPTGGSIETGVTKGRTILPIGTGGNIKVGDNASGMERIDITPLPSPNQRSNGNIVININAPLVDEYVVDSIIPAIRRAEQLNL
tara:strand:+ start:341 stop:1960 length:1620 start_codon:yes stop_codon:yes gene_type:complete